MEDDTFDTQREANELSGGGCARTSEFRTPLDDVPAAPKFKMPLDVLCARADAGLPLFAN